MYTVRILDMDKNLLGILPAISWKFNRKFNESTDFSVTLARDLQEDYNLDSTLYTLIHPHFPVYQEPSETASTFSTNLSYYLKLYKDNILIAMGKVAKRNFTNSTVTLKAHTEEYELARYSCPVEYSRVYEGIDICDLARDVVKRWGISRVKTQAEWQTYADSLNVDLTTEPGVPLLSKSGTAYIASGYITMEISRPNFWNAWERIRWSADSEAPVYTTMAYRTYDGTDWSAWSAEYEGAYPAEIGIEIATITAEKIQVRMTLTTDDTISEDDAGDPVGVTPRLFALEVVSRTEDVLSTDVPASSGVIVSGLEASEKTALQILQDACAEYDWEFYVLDGTLHLAESFGVTREIVFRNGTNVQIQQLSDETAEIYNVIRALGNGSGINRPLLQVYDQPSIDEYGVLEKTIEYDTTDETELLTLANADLADHKDPYTQWKLTVQYPYGDEPEFGIGDTVKVADPDSRMVRSSRIKQEIRSYSEGTLKIECYLGRVRTDMTPRRIPEYRDVIPVQRPIAIRVVSGYQSIVVTVPRMGGDWESTEVYISPIQDFSPSASSLVAVQKATQFEITGLDTSTRYYVKARYIKTNGNVSSFSEQSSAIPDSAIQGPPGEDGQSLFTWIKYADDDSGSGISDSPTDKEYIGIAYNKESSIESINPADYTWAKIEGDQGIPGTPGDDGESLYTWVKYADDESGSGMSDSPTGKDYIGLAYNKAVVAESSDPNDYTWSLYRGPQGDTGDPGQPARELSLSASRLTIQKTSRGTIYGDDITITALLHNLSLPAEGLTWETTNGNISAGGSGYEVVLALSSVTNLPLVITASMTYDLIDYTASVTITEVLDGKPAPYYFGLKTSLPTVVPPDSEPLLPEDYFLCDDGWAGPSGYEKGRIYKYTGSDWIETTDSDKVMMAMKDFVSITGIDEEELAVGNLFAENFIALSAVIRELSVNELQIYGHISVDHMYIKKGVFRRDRFYPEVF